ncbi:MAG: IS110 family transposase [bacterium]
MLNSTFVGLDVHKDTITIARANGYIGDVKIYGTINNNFKSLKKVLLKFNDPEHLKVCYEAGPCGYSIYRQLTNIGVECKVAAPSLIPRTPGNRVKTDRRDAKKLTSLFRSNELSFVWVPDKNSEALRDLIRARESAVQDLTRAKNRIKQFLLRYNIFPPQNINPWTVVYRQWLDKIKFEFETQYFVFREYVQAYDYAKLKVERFDKTVEDHSKTCSQADFINALKAFRGIKTITAATIACEIGDVRRFPHPRSIMAYLGTVPSEHSSGNTRHQGSITKTGNAHLRRVIVEACWHYRYEPKVSYSLNKRQKGVSPKIKDISWRTQVRLNKKYRRLLGRGKPKQVVITALARELIAFIWEAGYQVSIEQNVKNSNNENIA